jgi:hypothetical protein
MGPEPELLEARYANHFTVGHNAYEFLFEFGQFHFDPARGEDDRARIPIIRIVMGPPIAKVFLLTMRNAIRQYEDAHGALDESGEPEAATRRPSDS